MVSELRSWVPGFQDFGNAGGKSTVQEQICGPSKLVNLEIVLDGYSVDNDNSEKHTAKFSDLAVKASAAKSARPKISKTMTRISVGNVESMIVSNLQGCDGHLMHPGYDSDLSREPLKARVSTGHFDAVRRGQWLLCCRRCRRRVRNRVGVMHVKETHLLLALSSRILLAAGHAQGCSDTTSGRR